MKVSKYQAQVLAEVDARAAYEGEKNAENANIQATLKGIRSDLDHEAIAKVMSAANVPSGFINIAERGNARFNVYAAEKVSNLARVLVGAKAMNHYTRAILASARACGAAGVSFTHADAVAACSLEVKGDPSKPLVRYEKHIAPNTASTQASSSIAALKVWGALAEGRTPSNAVAYVLQDTETTEALLARI